MRADSIAAKYLDFKPSAEFTPDSLILQRIKYEIDICQSEHSKCPVRTNATLPSRVIKVGVEGETPKLHLCQNQNGAYVALSYCWGGKQSVTTTKESLKSRINGIPLNSLPKTIQEAIRLTRLLGYEYLWVDALCIIQDNQDDKSIEINAMGSIYKNATLTIAAANSDGVNKGFLREPSQPLNCKIPFLLPDGRKDNIYLRRDSPSEISNPLGSRGWTFQEDLLSSRLVSFGHHGLNWRCQSLNKELFTGTVYGDTESHSGKYRTSSIIIDNQTTNATRDVLTKEWQKIIEGYSGRVVTYQADRLPALAGVAGEFQAFLGIGDTYLAGFWESMLLSHIGWYSEICRSGNRNLHAGISRSQPGLGCLK